MSGLGKLGAFGKTNVLDVTGGLFKQYNEGLVNAENARKNRLIEELRIREEKRAEMKFNMEKADYDRNHEMLPWDDLKNKADSPELARMYEEFGRASGILVDRGGKTFIMRQDARNSVKDFMEWGAKRPQAVWQARLNDLDARIARAEEDLQGANNKEGEADLIRNQIQKLKNERRNLSLAEPEIQKAEAAARSKAGLTEELKTEHDKRMEKYAEEGAAAKNAADRALAAEREAKAQETKDNSKNLAKALTSANLAKVEEAVGEELTNEIFPRDFNAEIGAEEVRGGLKLPMGVKPNTPEFWQFVKAKRPEEYAQYVETVDKAEEIYGKHAGRISFKNAARLAITELREERMKRNQGTLDAMGYGRGRGSAPAQSAGGPKQGQSVSPEVKGNPILPGYDTPSTKWELNKNEFVVFMPYNYKNEKGETVESKDKTKTTFKAPPGFTNEDATELAHKIDEARSKGTDISIIIDKLMKIGFTHVRGY